MSHIRQHVSPFLNNYFISNVLTVQDNRHIDYGVHLLLIDLGLAYVQPGNQANHPSTDIQIFRLHSTTYNNPHYSSRLIPG